MIERKIKSRFWHISIAGVFFQGGAATIDTSTIVASLVMNLSNSSYAVGASAAILHYGWLFPQLFVGYFAQKKRRRLPFYMVGAFGRVVALVGVASIVLISGLIPGTLVIGLFFTFWALYAFISGIVAVPYNDIVARSIPSELRSRLLAFRFFGGGLLSLGVAGLAHYLIEHWQFPTGYSVILFLGAGLLLISTLSFVTAGEPIAPRPPEESRSFAQFLKSGLEIFRKDECFRLFVYARWLNGVVGMSLPFYVVCAKDFGLTNAEVAILLGFQITGALAANPLWGWWGDKLGEGHLLKWVSRFGSLIPFLAFIWLVTGESKSLLVLPFFSIVFFLIGALGNGWVIAQLGYLMEVSPDDQRPAYSGYFNALVSPAALSPIFGAALIETFNLATVFIASVFEAIIQILTIKRLCSLEKSGG